MSPRLLNEASLAIALGAVATVADHVRDQATQKRLLVQLHDLAVRVLKEFEELHARERARLGQPSDN